ncbi:MAG: aspartoacylase [Phenylobacterium sp.]|jgi:aspartoacylase
MAVTVAYSHFRQYTARLFTDKDGLMIKQVAIVGGTHGNEFTGVYLLKKWQQQQQKIERDSFTTQTVFANTKAFANNCRYIDNDLNRRFTQAQLDDVSLSGYEESRAKALNQQLGPKDAAKQGIKAKTDFIIDLHTTTSNMGTTLLLPADNQFYTQLAAYAKSKMPELTVFTAYADKSREDGFLLCTIAEQGVIIEVGPIPQGVLRQDVFEQTERLSHIILDFVDLRNRNDLPPLPATVSTFRFVDKITLPMDENGERLAMVHKNIQDKDFTAIHPGDPIFTMLTGEEVLYQGKEVVYPAFVNEAAYYDDNLAMSLLTKIDLVVE